MSPCLPADSLCAGWSLERILRAARRSVLDDPTPSNVMFRLRRQHVYKVAHRLGIPSERLRPGPDAADQPLPALSSLAERLTETGEVSHGPERYGRAARSGWWMISI